MGGTGDVAGLAVLRGQAGRGVLSERVAIPQMKRTHPVGSGGEAESVNTERGVHSGRHTIRLTTAWPYTVAGEVQQQKFVGISMAMTTVWVLQVVVGCGPL